MYSTSRKNSENTYELYFQNNKKYLRNSPSKSFLSKTPRLLSPVDDPSIIYQLKEKKKNNLTERNERISVPFNYSNLSFPDQKDFKFLRNEIKNLKKKNSKLKSDLHNEKKKNSGWSTRTYGTVKTKKKIIMIMKKKTLKK